jgi:hypothetical protein
MATIGLSNQKDAKLNLHSCRWSERMRTTNDESNKAACSRLLSGTHPVGPALGAFQSFPVARPNQIIYFAREIGTGPSYHLLSQLFERVAGNPLSPAGRALVLNIAQAPENSNVPSQETIQEELPFHIDDSYDPMMPLTRSSVDFRFLSVTSRRQRTMINLINFHDPRPRPAEMKLRMESEEVALHESWARRPVLVIDRRDDQVGKPQILLSRSALVSVKDVRVRQGILADGNVPHVENVDFSLKVGRVVPARVSVVEVPPALIEIDPTWLGHFVFVARDDIIIVDRNHKIVAKVPEADGVRFQFVLLENDGSGSDERSLSYRGGATCDVVYRIVKRNSHRACLRRFASEYPMRASPAAMTKATQLLVGRFDAADDLGLALVDKCFDQRPIIFDQKAVESGTVTYVPAGADGARPDLKRSVACSPLRRPTEIRGPISLDEAK